MNEHVGVDDEGLYIDLSPNYPLPPPNPQSQGGSKEREGESSGVDDMSTDFDDESSESSSDDEVSDIDDMVKDREPKHMPDIYYDKKDPPMSVGTVYLDMDGFKIALATHAIKHEFNYDIEKSDPGRYRVNCSQKSEGYRWRLHASTIRDGHTVKVMCYYIVFIDCSLLLFQCVASNMCTT
jgi:hypothetical protein